MAHSKIFGYIVFLGITKGNDKYHQKARFHVDIEGI